MTRLLKSGRNGTAARTACPSKVSLPAKKLTESRPD